ncbi:MAG TPA: MurR/RpiR family transcriptional regulator [Fusobacterium ulcerans]|jgi:RpiR family carbohydrate utilization transcriptional regulator|uniref:MurR/RpiR family transcriptional regulator n=1 Tax=Fusobacterium ulcerans TaxID=861 RepID=UPI000E499751|nr:MurR/RpiR family transcriptional regulator [Fusobacterium ulcerans]RGY64016.1 MurR/RpiR family transcriptional regulator [Fusobacterium ulcerans]HJH07897.1 MurR/RpiR family transcriptional regulator [Fusobacterium ulcerans]
MYSFFSNLKKCRDNSDLYPSVEVVIANYILENHDFIPEISIKEFAKKCNTSISTVSRFCRRINDSDFKTLKEECRIYNSFLKEKEVHRKNEKKNYFRDLNDSLLETEKLNDEAIYDQAINLIKKSKKIYFFGTSFSNILAQNASEKFMRLGKNTICPLAASSQNIEVKKIKEDDLAFIISFSNNNFQMNRIKKYLREKRINTIFITSKKDSKNINEIFLMVSSKVYKEFESPLIQEIATNYIINNLYLKYVEDSDKK